MKQYKRVLVATDLSNVNRAALARAVDVSKEYHSELILLHVIEHFPFDAGPLSPDIPPELKPEHAMVQSAHQKLSTLAAELGVEKARREVTVTPKSAQREILRFAEADGVDLIVVAPHERGFLGSLGSTAVGVVNGATCDVLTVRERA
jgi:universal stress protein A